MPHVTVNGATLFYEEQGEGPETICFAHGLLWSGDMFANQVEALKDQYRCITFDFRGQGRSEVTTIGYDMDTLTDDAAALIEKLVEGPVHFVGLSMGGFVAIRLAARYPHLVSSLTILESSAEEEPPESAAQYRRLNTVARWLGLGLVSNKVMDIMFGEAFMKDPGRSKQREEWRDRLVNNHRLGITRAVKGVIAREAVLDLLPQITVPTLIMVGNGDVATVPAKSELMHQHLTNSDLVIIPRAGHTSTVEEPEFVNKQMAAFLARLSATVDS